MAKRKPVIEGGEHHSPVPEAAQSASVSEPKGGHGTTVAEFEAPEFQRELANFIKVIGDIRSRPPDSSYQALDNEGR